MVTFKSTNTSYSPKFKNRSIDIPLILSGCIFVAEKMHFGSKPYNHNGGTAVLLGTFPRENNKMAGISNLECQIQHTPVRASLVRLFLHRKFIKHRQWIALNSRLLKHPLRTF